MNKSFAFFAGCALAVTGVLSSCDNYTTTPTASPAPVDTTTPWTATVAFSPIAGTYPDAQSVTLSATDTTASIHYTVDGSVPTSASTLYTGAIPVTATTRIKAITVKGGVVSVVSVAAYDITIPTFRPAAGVYNASQSVKLSSSDPNAAIYYTTDGSAPTRSSSIVQRGDPGEGDDDHQRRRGGCRHQQHRVQCDLHPPAPVRSRGGHLHRSAESDLEHRQPG